jgi:aspartyl-tRNA(Asn)/glutamyl-tRNA(Gln) amidotransferase subunit B
MPDPDLPPVVLSESYVNTIKASMPKLPDDYRKAFSEIGLSDTVIEDVIANPDVANTVMNVLDEAGANHVKRIAFWLMQPQTDDADVDTDSDAVALDVNVQNLIQLSEMVEANKLSSTAAKEVLSDMLKTGKAPEEIAEAKNLLQESDEVAIAAIVAQVLSDNAKAAEDVRNGEMKAIGFLVGQVMKQSKGKANPALAMALIEKQLAV